MTYAADLGETTWSEVPVDRSTLLIPLGSLEQHGPHLPLDTDTRIASAVSRSAQAQLAGEVVDHAGEGDNLDLDPRLTTYVAPDIAYGASGEHEGFPGTISVGSSALQQMLIEYGRSAGRWGQRMLFVNGHGGNVQALRAAVDRLRMEGRDVAWFPCATPHADAHAGKSETSLLLHISPDLVRSDRVAVGNVAPIGELMGALRSDGVAAVSPNGILGDPTEASAAAGRALFESMVDRLVSAVRRWQVEADGRLR